MSKDFDKWNEIKKQVHNRRTLPFYREREMWWCTFGVNVGLEHDGKGKRYQRPVLIIKGLSKNTCFVLPLTKSNKQHKYRVVVGNVDGVGASVIISQARVIDTKRLNEKISVLNKDMFGQIKTAIRDKLL